jgi:hypothetical protein
LKTSLLAKLGDLLALPPEPDRADPSRSAYERFAIPHSFKPRLSLTEAAVAAGGAALRIFLGSLLFAVWGTYSLMAWGAVQNVFLRGVMVLFLLALFVVLLAALMLAISGLGRMISPRRPHS